MLKNYFEIKIKEYLDFEPTSDQNYLIKILINFIFENDNNSIFLLKGYAGTGKTYIISAVIKALNEFNIRTILLAPTGRAAKVLSSFAQVPAYTIHKKIYRQKSTKDIFGKFVLDRNLYTNTIFIVDEASMLSNISNEQKIFGSGNLLDDLISYVYSKKGCKLILIGDDAQLPPVGMDNSPALQTDTFTKYNLNVYEYTMTEIVRQKSFSKIHENATLVREMINNKILNIPVFKTDENFQNINGKEVIDHIENAYSKYGLRETLIINRSNKRSNIYNKEIRNSILGREEILEPGDILMVVRNNYYWTDNHYYTLPFLANGDMVEVLKIKKWYEMYNYQFADVILYLIDYDEEIEARILLNTLNSDSPSLTEEENKELFYNIFKDFENVKPRKKAYELVKTNIFYNALQVKYAYSLTCHKAQGGQWKCIFIDPGIYINENLKLDITTLRWLYTAITRSVEKVYLINYPFIN